MKRKVVPIILILAIAVIVFMAIKAQKNIIDYLEVDNYGYYYEKNIVDKREAVPNFYATLQTNRLKYMVTGKIVNAKMSKMQGYNLQDIVCISQLIKNQYEFTFDEKKEIQTYLQSLQDNNNNSMVVVGIDEQASYIENLLFYTAEALEITEKLQIKLNNIERIKEFVQCIKLDGDSSKITVSLVKIDKILGTRLYNSEEITVAYQKIYQKWMEYPEADLNWVFDIYYMSYIYKYANLENSFLYAEFENDICNIIQHIGTDMTIKVMFAEISQNYNLLTDEVKSNIQQTINKMENLCSKGNNEYSILMEQRGDITTTYYVYLYYKYNKKEVPFDKKLYSDLMYIVKADNYKAYSNQELMQAIYILKEMGIKPQDNLYQLDSYLKNALSNANDAENIYWIARGYKLLQEDKFDLNKDSKKHIKQIISKEIEDCKSQDMDIYEKMKKIFFCLNTIVETPEIEYGEYILESSNILMSSNVKLDEDLRILYFYESSCEILNLKNSLNKKHVDYYYSNGFYYINPYDKELKSILYQYMGLVLKSGKQGEIPII